MNAATSPFFNSASNASKSLNGMARQSGRNGAKPSRKLSSPFTPSAPLVRPWKDFLQWMSAGLPVAHLAYLMAVSTPSAPELVKNTMSSSFGIRFFNSAASRPESNGASIFTRLG